MGKIAELIVQLGADNEDLRRGLKKARTDMEKFQESAKTISNSMIGLGAAAVGAMGGIVKSASDWAAAVNDIEDKTGMAGQSASKLLYIAKAVGLETADAADAVTKMSRSVAQAVEQQEKANIAGRESVDVYTKYGIAIKDANGNMLSTTQILSNIAEKHRTMANGIQKTNMEMEIFGRSGAKLNDMLNLTSEQMAKMTENAHRAGLVMDGETTQAWEDLTIQMNETKMVMMGVAVQIGNALLPSIKELARMISNGAKKFSNLSETEKEVIMFTLKTATVMGGLGLAIRAVTFTCGPMVEGIMSIVKALIQMRNMAITAKAATMGLMATAAVAGFAVINGAIEKYQAFEDAGVDAFTYDTEDPYNDQVSINYEAVEKAKNKKNEEKLRKAQEAAEKAEREAMANAQALTGMDFGGVSSVGGGGGGGSVDHSLAESKRQAEELAEKIKDIQANIADSNKEAINLARNFEESGIVLEESLLVGSEKIKAEIEAEARQRNAVLDDYLERYKESVVEAERLRQEAEATGNAELIKQATAYLEERKQAEIQAEQEIQDRRIAIREEAERKATAISTQAREIQADLQRAFDEGDLASYVALLDEKHAKFLTDLQEKQALMQAYYDWRMQAEETQAKLQIDVMNKLKDGLSTAFADAVVNSKNLIGSIMELGKQIVAMYIKERMQQAISSMFAKKKLASDVAATTAAAASASAAWAPAAAAASIATGGTAAKSGIIGLQAALATVPSLFTSQARPFATGGLVYGPTLGLIGEGQHSEAVLPLSENTYSQLAKGINEQGGGNSVVLNVSAIDASGFESWLRRTGGNTIKKYLSDQRLEFKLEGGII